MRRISSRLLALVVLVPTLTAIPGPASQAALRKPPAVVLGIWTEEHLGHTTEVLEAQIGRKFGGFRFNHGIMDYIPSKQVDANYDAGRKLGYQSAEASDAKGKKICFGQIATGSWDGRLAQIVKYIKADTRFTHETPFLFAFHHEPEPSWCGTPEGYKADFRHIFAVFESAGILWRYGGQVEMVWTMTRSQFNQQKGGGLTEAQQYDPDLAGDGLEVVGDYYDLIGADIYDKKQSDGHLSYTDPHVAFDPVHQYALSRGKPFGIFELGVSQGTPGEKATFFSQVVSTLKSYGVGVPGSCVVMMYSNVMGKQPYWIDTTRGSLSAFTTMANDPLFLPS